jgi:NAD(P)-dependent dehydrogenase (short-subunit alcohol dehydrogenase family)
VRERTTVLNQRTVPGARQEVDVSRSVVVTGASTGIGRATVGELVAAGFQVWATVRRESDATSLHEEFGDAVTTLLVDLEDHASVRAAGERVCAAGPLWGLVNNAGAALPGPLELLPIEVFRRQLDINLVGQLLMTQVMLPGLFAAAEQLGEARIVMIGSVGGRIAGPILGAYHAAKHGLVGLAGALRAELAPSRIRVLLIEPGAIATPIWGRGGAFGDELVSRYPAAVQQRYAGQMERAREMARHGQAKGLPPEVPARVILSALTTVNPKPRQSVGRDARVVAVLVRLLPFRLVYRLAQARR